MSLPRIPQRTTPGFSFSIVDRALRDCIAERDFGQSEAEAVAEYFEHECAYCGGPIQRWDHLVAISTGGDTVVGNMVPACSKCDDSKQGHDFERWAFGESPGSPASRGITDLERRLARIRGYLTAHRYRPREPEERLTASELQRFNAIRNDLAAARCDFDEFLHAYRLRTGLK